jgi:hypothetical protein
LTAPIPNQLFSVITAQTGDSSSSGMTWVDGVTVLPPDENGSNLLPLALLTMFAPTNFTVSVEGNLLSDRAVHALHFPNQLTFPLDRPLSFNDLALMSQIRQVISSCFSDAGTKASIAATMKERDAKEAEDEEDDGEETGTQNRRRRYRDEIVPLISDSTTCPQLLERLYQQVGTCPWPNSRVPKGKRGFTLVVNPEGHEAELFPPMLDMEWMYQEELRKQREEEERRRQKELEKQRLRQETIRREKDRKERERMERERKKQEEKMAALAAKKGKGKGKKNQQAQAPSSPHQQTQAQQNQGWGGNWGGNEQQQQQQQQWSPKPKQQAKQKAKGGKGQAKGSNAFEYPTYHGAASGQGQGMNFNQLAQQFLQANQNNPNLFHQPQHSPLQQQQAQQPQHQQMQQQFLMQNFRTQ